MLRGPGSEWSHLEQSRDGPEALRGLRSEWSHLEQNRDSPERAGECVVAPRTKQGQS